MKNNHTNAELIKKMEEEVAVNIAATRPLLETNLFKFNRHILQMEKGKGNVKMSQVHREMCEFIDKNKKRKKLLLIPRGHLKSTVVTIGRTLQVLCQDPTKRVLIANANYKLACGFLTDIKRHLRHNEKLKMFWGDIAAGAPVWNNDSIMLAGANKKEPNVVAKGVESDVTSQHYDVIILDDLVNATFVNTQDQIQKTIDFYKETLNLLEPGGEVIIIGTRWHDSDLYNWIEDKDNAVFEDFDFFVKKAYDGDLFDKEDKSFVSLFPEKHSRRHLQQLYKQLGPYVFSCTPAGTKVLMDDWSFKPIEQVKKGDCVVGFKSVDGGRRQYVSSRVLANGSRESKVNEIQLESGNMVRCTPDHKWFTGRGDAGDHRVYSEAGFSYDQLKSLQFGFDVVEELPEDKKQIAGWVGGMFDADGCVSSQLTFTQSEVKHPKICEKIKQNLTLLGFEYREYRSKSRPGIVMIGIQGGRQACLKFLSWCKPVKSDRIIQYLYKRSKRLSVPDKITSISSGTNVEKVYSMQTETGNYIADGYLSKNCQYMNDPIPAEDADFKRDWFQYYDPTELKGRLLNKFTMIDPAISVEKDADFTAIVTVGVDEFNMIYVLDVVRKHMKPKELIDTIFKVYELYRPIKIGIEDVAFQKALQYSLHEEMNARQVYLPLQPLRPAGRNKDQRIRGLQPLYANGKILHNKTILNNVNLEDELLRFPRGKHDDVIDALAYMLDIPVFSPKRKVTRHKSHRYLYA